MRIQEKRKSNGSSTGNRTRSRPVSVRLEVVRAYLDFIRGSDFRDNPPEHIIKKADRRLYVKMLRGMVRHRRLLESEMERFSTNKRNRKPSLEAAVMLGLYQLRFLDRVPAHAAVNETVALANALKHPWGKGWINAILRSAQREKQAGTDHTAHLPLGVRTSYPDWMVDRWSDNFGKAKAETICEAGNREGGATLRVEKGRMALGELVERLAGEDIRATPHPLFPEALQVEQTGELLASRAFADGLCYLQDISSIVLMAWCAPLFKGRVVDVCAAPGGKLSLLAGWRRPGLLLGGVDISAERLGLVRENFNRLRLPPAPLLVADSRRLPFPDAAPINGILLDAPCSATGTIAKYPELKWRRQESDLARHAETQGKLLAEAARVVRPGGFVLYVTCSLEPEENQNVIGAFLKETQNFSRLSFKGLPPPRGLNEPGRRFITPEGDFLMLPGPHRMGLYGALVRKGTGEEDHP